jgi:hypothetical protein
LRSPLELNQCHLRHRLNLAKAEAPNLNLRGSYLRARLSARRLRVAHTLNLSTGFRCDGGVVLREAHVGGQLDCDEAVCSHAAARSYESSSRRDLQRSHIASTFDPSLRKSVKTARKQRRQDEITSMGAVTLACLTREACLVLLEVAELEMGQRRPGLVGQP